MMPFKCNTKHNPDNLFFLLVDNLNSQILETSRSFFKLLQILGYNELKSSKDIYIGNSIRIDELLEGFPISKLKNDSKTKKK